VSSFGRDDVVLGLDREEQATAKADPYGMTNKRTGNSDSNGNGNGKSNSNMEICRG
jgi:hypothetical protein